VWRFGVVWFGGLYFLTNTLVRWLSNDPAQRYEPGAVMALIAVSFAYSLSLGAVFGFAAWYLARLLAWWVGRLNGRVEERAPEPVLRAQSAATNK
jgi:hypothetical protein